MVDRLIHRSSPKNKSLLMHKKGDAALKNNRISRKEFLKILGGFTVAGGFAMAGCLRQPITPTTTIEPTTLTTTETMPLTITETTTVGTKGKTLVSIVKGNSDTDIETMVRQTVNAIGGIEKIVSSGQTVVVKPAVVIPNPNCAPDPRVVATVAKLAQEAGGTVIVAESSGGGDTTDCLSKTGITSAVEEVGAEVRILPKEEEIQLEVPNGVALTSVKIYPTIHNCDVLISVPRLKRHSEASVTISLKNMMGTMPKSEMLRFHDIDLSQCIADLNTLLKPDLAVVDATFAMTRTGPLDGDMAEMNTIMASRDLVAIDRVAAQRLQEREQQLGINTLDAANVKHINAASALRVGTSNLNKIMSVEEYIV